MKIIFILDYAFVEVKKSLGWKQCMLRWLKFNTAAGATWDEGNGHLRQYENLYSLKT